MDVLDGEQPHCPDDDVVMRDVPGGWCCPDCGHVEMLSREDAERPMPPGFEGSSIHGG